MDNDKLKIIEDSFAVVKKKKKLFVDSMVKKYLEMDPEFTKACKLNKKELKEQVFKHAEFFSQNAGQTPIIETYVEHLLLQENPDIATHNTQHFYISLISALSKCLSPDFVDETKQAWEELNKQIIKTIEDSKDNIYARA